MKKRMLAIFMAMTALMLAACGPSTVDGPVESEGGLNIVTSFYPMYEFTREVVGDSADVSVLVSGSEGAHGYEPSAKDIAALNEADLFVYSSDEMEYWVEAMLSSVENDDLVVVRASDVSDVLVVEDHDHDHDHHDDHGHDDHDHHDHDHGDHDHDHDHGGIDPHNWIDPVTAIGQVGAIKDAIVELDPENEEIYTTNAKNFQDQLTELDEEYTEKLAEATNRIFVVQHKAFGHLAARYDLEQISAGGINTDLEPTPVEIARVTEVVKETGVPVIYYQSGSNSKVAETIAKETGTEVAVLYDLERAPKDVNPEGEELTSYIEAMEFNLEQLLKSIN